MRAALLIALLLTGKVYAADEVPALWSRLKQQGPIIHVRAASPTPFMTGYREDTKECALLVNDNVEAPTGTPLLVFVAHEAGHCHQLHLGRQLIEAGPTRMGESFSDVYALAWVAINEPELLDEATQLLLDHRMADRRVNSAYNTLTAIRMAAVSMPRAGDPLAFALHFFD